MVHADIKPGNVLLRPDGAAVLADFGIAGYIGERPEAAPGMTVGTVAYMSPEQARGEALGPASDLYSLGAVMYELLVGRPPHVGATPADVARLQVTAEPIAPRLLDPTVPPAVDRLVVRALSKRPEARWPSASAMLVDVEQCEAAADDVTRTLVAVGDRGADKPDAGWSRGRPAVWVAAGALCLAAAIAFAAFVRPIASASAGPRATPTSQARPSATPSTFEQIIIGGISSPTPTPTGSASPTGPTATPTSVPARTPGPDPRIVPVPTRPTWETPVASTFTVAIPPQGTSRHLINASLRSDEAVRARITVTGGKRDVQLTVLAGDGSVIVEPVVVSDDETFVWPVRRRAPWTLVIDNNSSLLIGKIVTVSYEVIRLD
jgi:serine/threonine-protein kinase